jgi:hypothetical protein
MSKLTRKEEDFAQALAAGMKTADAYRSVYNTTATGSSLTSTACNIANKEKIVARVAEIKSEIRARYTWTREQSVMVLAEIALNEENKKADRINATKELNAMHGYNAPIQVEHRGEFEITTIELVAPTMKDVVANQ